MARLAALIVSLGIFVAVGLGSAHAEKRVALVIGNSDYNAVADLPNPQNDARDMADLLRDLGFDVTLAVDQSFREMRLALRDFGRDARGADIAAVYYAGHGIEIDKHNYLIPIDASLASDRDVRFETIALEDVLLALEGADGLQMVILDACRENPFAANMERAGATRSIGRGLARIEPEGSSVLVAYAAREGQVAEDGGGRNSPYTTALLENLATPGMEIGLLFRKVRASVMAATDRAQQPFVYASLGEAPLYLVPPTSDDATSPDVDNSATFSASARDEAAQAWAVTQNTDSIAVLQAFIETFDGTVYAELAVARLSELEASRRDDSVDSSPIRPDFPALQGYEVRIVQAEDELSGVWRIDAAAPQVRRYYIIVEAVAPDGSRLTLPIKNEETGLTEDVTRWGQRVSEKVFQSIKSDKSDDGSIQNNVVAIFHNDGRLRASIIDTQDGAITEW